MADRICLHCGRQPAKLYGETICQPCSFTVDSVKLLATLGAAYSAARDRLREAVTLADRIYDKVDELSDKLDALERGRDDPT